MIWNVGSSKPIPLYSLPLYLCLTQSWWKWSTVVLVQVPVVAFSPFSRTLSHLPIQPQTHTGTFLSIDATSVQRTPAFDESIGTLIEVMMANGITSNHDEVLDHWQRNGFNDVTTLLLVAQDFVERPEAFSSLLIQDFGFPPLVAHQTRAMAMRIIQSQQRNLQQSDLLNNNNNNNNEANTFQQYPDVWEAPLGSFQDAMHSNQQTQTHSISLKTIIDSENRDSPLDREINQLGGASCSHYKNMKQSIVNAKAAQRRKSNDKYTYGLPVDYEATYTTLASELKAFYRFMTEPSTLTQEDPIRPATAQIYHRHAKLFLGWFLHAYHQETLDSDAASISIYSIIPSKDKESANVMIEFVLWLRRERNISDAYEANLLRGLIKFLKFRFSKESETDSSYGGLTFTDIPLIKELRKLHRTAYQKSRVAPKSSDEQKKWLSWPEFLTVIQKAKDEAMTHIENFGTLIPGERRYRNDNRDSGFSLQEEEIAALFQKYLILAIFANIPDRQRTIRELEIGRTLIKEDGYWFVKHGPDDYKTGKVYGERPPLLLSPELTPAIDEFINLWRPALRPSTNFLFVQTRTGKPMTGDSIFQRVTRSCFKYTGKRTNPHLLRSMIITHVREESNASEKELEALALFMGHSIQMQRSSYDKRTLKKKIAPAVQLIQSVNQNISPS